MEKNTLKYWARQRSSWLNSPNTRSLKSEIILPSNDSWSVMQQVVCLRTLSQTMQFKKKKNNSRVSSGTSFVGIPEQMTLNDKSRELDLPLNFDISPRVPSRTETQPDLKVAMYNTSSSLMRIFEYWPITMLRCSNLRHLDKEGLHLQ